MTDFLEKTPTDERGPVGLMKVHALQPRTLAIVLTMLIVPVVLSYSNIFNAELIYDDKVTLLDNPAIKSLWPPSLFQGYLSNFQYINQTNYTRPVAQFSFALNHALGGFTPWGYHAVNLAIHVLATVLLFGILRRTLLTPLLRETFGEAASGVAVAGALLWGVHPLNTMDVTYTSPRMEELMALFYLSTLYCWIRGVQGQSRRWLALSVASSFLGMMSKEVMVTAPVMVLLYDGLFLACSWRQALRRRWPWYGGLAVSVGLLVFLVLNVPGEHGAFLSHATLPNSRGAYADRWSYAATMPGVLLYYLRLVAWPAPLVFDYIWPVASSWMAVALPGIVVAAGALAAGWGLVRRQSWAYPIAWYLIALLPSSSFIPLYDDYIAEYRAYLPTVGPVVLAVCVGWVLLRKIGWSFSRTARTGAFAGTVLVCVLGGLTWARNTDYRTELSISLDTVAKAPGNTRAHVGLGDVLLKQGRYDDAAKEYREALRLYPGNVFAQTNLGVALMDQGRLTEALTEFQDILRTKPDNVEAHINVGVIFQQQGHPDWAFQEFREALRFSPVNSVAAFNLAGALTTMGRNGEAIEIYRQVLRIYPGYSQARNNLGVLYRKQGKLTEAAAQFRIALQINASDILAALNLGSILDTLGQFDEAAAALLMAIRLGPQDVSAHVVLGDVLLKQGKPEEAVREFQEVVRLKPLAVNYNNLAVALARLGDKDASLQARRRALEIDPGNIDARDNIRALEAEKNNGK